MDRGAAVSPATISGIARPESFEDGLRKLGVELIYSRRYADHHRFSEGEIAKMFERSKARGARAVITTEKDLINLGPLSLQLVPLHTAQLRIELESPEQVLKGLLKTIEQCSGQQI